jgi:aspartyl-tRNA(Asn)/glutamyl-tRNA(Gln) amidotransferase subunit A
VSGLRQGAFSSRELTQAYLDRIERLDPVLRTYITLTVENVLAQADEADGKLRTWRRSSGSHIPPLLGVPIAVKDVLAVEGMRTTAG